MCTHRPPPANNNITVARFFAKIIIIIIPDPPVYNIIYYTCTYNVTFYRVGSSERMIVTAVENGNNRGIPTTIQRRGTIFSSRTVCARGRCNSVIYGVLSPERQNFLFSNRTDGFPDPRAISHYHRAYSTTYAIRK